MSEAGSGGFARSIQVLWDEGTATGLVDAELIERFLLRDAGAEGAFSVLVRRHAPMVLRVCRDVIGDPHDAQDAAQATFLILARNSRSILRRGSIASWLFGTARRVALRAVRDASRRRRHERQYAESIASRNDHIGGIPESVRDWAGLFDELERLPERYRAAIVLCDLEGRTHEQAASTLGCPTRTLQTRLYRGRERLRGRLVRRGLLPASSLATGILTTEAGAGVVPASWIIATSGLAVGRASAAGLSASAVALIKGVNQAMFLTQLKWITAFAGFATLSVGVTFGLVAGGEGPPAPGEAVTNPKPAVKVAPLSVQDKLDGTLFDLAGKPIATMIHLSGRATDSAAKPIAGASIFLISPREPFTQIGKTVTDNDGRYNFLNAALPLPLSVDGPVQGYFQVYGRANGFGFAWHGMRLFQPRPRPNDWGKVVGGENTIFRDEPIVMDLKFTPTATLSGHVIDESGRPIVGANVNIIACDYLDTNGKETDYKFREFLRVSSIPDTFSATRTGAGGLFQLEGLPKEAEFWIHFGYRPREDDHMSTKLYAATTNRPVTGFTYPRKSTRRHLKGQSPVFTGEFDVTVRANRKISLRTVFADTRQAAPKVRISARRSARSFEAGGTTDDQGKLQLMLPPGEYGIEAEPILGGAECVSTGTVIEVLEAPEQTFEVSVAPGAIVILEAVDSETGKGIPGIMFQCGKGNHPAAWTSVQSHPELKEDHPRTNAEGRLRIVIEPGDWSFRPIIIPESTKYIPVDEEMYVKYEHHKTKTVRFELKKR